ncbi:MAG: hypothetical protein V7703_19705 [Hyphomicrobiales bacterium]
MGRIIDGHALTGARDTPECLDVELDFSVWLAVKNGPSSHRDLQFQTAGSMW